MIEIIQLRDPADRERAKQNQIETLNQRLNEAEEHILKGRCMKTVAWFLKTQISDGPPLTATRRMPLPRPSRKFMPTSPLTARSQQHDRLDFMGRRHCRNDPCHHCRHCKRPSGLQVGIFGIEVWQPIDINTLPGY